MLLAALDIFIDNFTQFVVMRKQKRTLLTGA